MPHDSYAFLKCCESLAFLVRDAAHITTENFESCVHCIRTFVEASTNGGNVCNFLCLNIHIALSCYVDFKFNAKSRIYLEILSTSEVGFYSFYDAN